MSKAKKPRAGWPSNPQSDPLYPFADEPAYRKKQSKRAPKPERKARKVTLGQIKREYARSSEE